MDNLSLVAQFCITLVLVLLVNTALYRICEYDSSYCGLSSYSYYVTSVEHIEPYCSLDYQARIRSLDGGYIVNIGHRN